MEKEDSNDPNEFENYDINSFQVDWNQPATRGDLRNLSAQMDSRFNVLRYELRAMINRTGLASTATTITIVLAALGLVVSVLK